MLFLLRDQHLKVGATYSERGKQDPNWAFNSILKFVLEEKKRVEGKAGTESTEFPRARYLQYNRSQKAQRLEI